MSGARRPARRARQAGKRRVQPVRPDVRDGSAAGQALEQGEAAELALVAVEDGPALEVQPQAQVLVGPVGRIREELSGHAQVQQELPLGRRAHPLAEVEEEVLAVPLHGEQPLADQGSPRRRRRGPQARRPARGDGVQAPPQEDGAQTAGERFDFGQLGHAAHPSARSGRPQAPGCLPAQVSGAGSASPGYHARRLQARQVDAAGQTVGPPESSAARRPARSPSRSRATWRPAAS